MNLKFRRHLQALKYGWIDSNDIAIQNKVSHFTVFRDILKYYRRYNLWSYHYKKDQLWGKTEEQKEEIAKKVGAIYKQRDIYVQYKFEERRFLSKYSSLRYERSPRLMKKRNDAYRDRYHLDESVNLLYGVMISTEHYTIGELKVGSSCLFGRNVDIDYTGGLEIGDHVSIMDGAKILTHAHDYFKFNEGKEYLPFSHYAFKTPLKIGNNTSIGSRAIIMPGVSEIGDNSMISAGSVVKEKVPSNCIVAGNPATVVAKIPRGLKRVYQTSSTAKIKRSVENRDTIVESLDNKLHSKK